MLRLKGGDPCVFGRGGEEALALAAAGVPFRIVPGITAGIGGLAYAGIPVTHRDTNSAVTFLTGHDSGGEVPGALDWDAIARGSPVLVLYMASRHLPNIVKRLLAAGRRSDEPAAIVSQATTPEQAVLVSTLGEIVGAAAGHSRSRDRRDRRSRKVSRCARLGPRFGKERPRAPARLSKRCATVS